MEMSSGEEAAPPPVHPPRPRPNVLVTGTPGTGKSSTAELLVDILGAGFTRVVVGDLVREHHFFDELDPGCGGRECHSIPMSLTASQCTVPC